jgi:hypothetical protein
MTTKIISSMMPVIVQKVSSGMLSPLSIGSLFAFYALRCHLGRPFGITIPEEVVVQLLAASLLGLRPGCIVSKGFVIQ